MASNPVAFLDTVTQRSALVGCEPNGPYGVVYSGGTLPLAFNADGSRNTCANAAAPASVATLFLGGLGVTSPPQVTGAITPNPGAPLSQTVGVSFNGVPTTVGSASTTPGSISGIWQVAIVLGMNGDLTGAIPVSLSVGGVPVRDAFLTVWVK